MKGRGEKAGLFDAEGRLQRHLFDPKAWAVLENTAAWLEELGRSLFLPIDLIVVLLRQGHDELGERLAQASRGSGGSVDILADIEALARKVDREKEGKPELHLDHFSLGFLGILEDALNWTREAGWDRIGEDDLVRVVRWRAEVQESASVRWAIRQLATPGGERLFDSDGLLKVTAFVDRTWAVMQQAMQLAAQSGMPFLGTPHLIAVLCSQRGGILWKAAEKSGVDPRRLRDELQRIVGVRTPPQAPFMLSRRTLTPRLARMLTQASERASKESGRILEPHLIDAFLADGGSSFELVKALGLETEIRSFLGDPKVIQNAATGSADHEELWAPSSTTPTLDLLGRDLTREAREGRLPVIIGRERELNRIVNVLMRQEQRNPLLTGEAGVGKTALAAALASLIAQGLVPRRLRGYRVVEVNGASLIGGTSYRGDLEARIKALLAEARENVILFMDEAHAVFAPRSGSGQPAEVPNHFKAALASGDLAVVAATTDVEYNRWIEQDPALKRRFERIEIPEPDEETTRAILNSLVGPFEQAYDVIIADGAVEAALDLSVRFLPEQRLPDKAKKLLMDAAIACSIDEAAGGSTLGRSRNETTPMPAATSTAERPVVTRETVAGQVALKTGLPLDRLAPGDRGWWVNLGDRLRLHADGQDAAIDQLSRALVVSRLRSGLGHGPQAVLVFLGPPGVGKADLARALAREVFADPKALLRLSMSDYQEAHALSRLIGSPPGYVGYQDGDALVTPLRRRPCTVVLLEEFDRAHPQVQDRFLALFEEGTISDTRGMTASARHALFILTVTTSGDEGAGIGFSVGGDERSDPRRGHRLLEQHAQQLARRLRGHSYEVIPFVSPKRDGGAMLSARFERRLTRLRVSLLEEYGLRLDIAPDEEASIRAEVAALTDARDLEDLLARRLIEPVTEQLMRGVNAETLAIGAREAPSGAEPQKDELAQRRGDAEEDVGAPRKKDARTREEAD